jgi:glutathione S-transferase
MLASVGITMMEYIEVEQAVHMRGLRVVLSPGLPQPWSEAAKSLLYLKRLPYVRVRQELFGENVPLSRWTSQASAPVAVWNDEPPRSNWIDQLYLFERLAPEPRMIPEDFEQRVLMFGLAREICGECGYTWRRRHELVREYTGSALDEQTHAIFKAHGDKYGFTAELGAIAVDKLTEILRRLGAHLESQRRAGSQYFIGRSLTALDVYWACHATTILPLPQEICPMAENYRAAYTATNPKILAAVSPILLTHRDYIYQQHLELPLTF